MTDFSKFENDLILQAAKSAGEYLVEICKTDFATMTAEERLMFLQCFVKAHQGLSKQFPFNDEIPF